MKELKLVQVGCGGMGLRHIYGQSQLKKHGFKSFDLTAVCDIHKSSAEHVASIAKKELNKQPNIYTNFEKMIEKERPDVVDIVTDTRFHHEYAIKALENGAHVAIEKPMALTVRACQKIIETAERTRKIVSVSENYRRDPLNRLTKALIDAKILGEPRIAVDINFTGSRVINQFAAWRHMKLRGGWALEYGVHNADLLLYFMGNIDTIYANTKLWEKERYNTTASTQISDTPTTKNFFSRPINGLNQFYNHRVKEQIDKNKMVQCTAEDTVLSTLQFSSGTLGQLSLSIAALGQGLSKQIFYCDNGSLIPSGSRSGNPLMITKHNSESTMPEEEILQLVPDFQLDPITSPFFENKKRVSSYTMDWKEIDQKLIAIEMQDFANAVLRGEKPEVTGEIGLKAVALSYSILESGYSKKPVNFIDVIKDKINGYQQEINDYINL